MSRCNNMNIASSFNNASWSQSPSSAFLLHTYLDSQILYSDKQIFIVPSTLADIIKERQTCLVL
jgi:hypothetical protein